jgi:hypothetical protein
MFEDNRGLFLLGHLSVPSDANSLRIDDVSTVVTNVINVGSAPLRSDQLAAAVYLDIRKSHRSYSPLKYDKKSTTVRRIFIATSFLFVDNVNDRIIFVVAPVVLLHGNNHRTGLTCSEIGVD